MLLTSELDFACFLLPCLACILVTRGLVLRLASLIIETIQEHETRIEERGAECREQAGAPSSWLAGGPVQPSQPTLICQTPTKHAWSFSTTLGSTSSLCILPHSHLVSLSRTKSNTAALKSSNCSWALDLRRRYGQQRGHLVGPISCPEICEQIAKQKRRARLKYWLVVSPRAELILK